MLKISINVFPKPYYKINDQNRTTLHVMQNIFDIIRTNKHMQSLMKCVRVTELENKLNRPGFSYDLLILPDQLTYATELVAEFADQKFIIDHLAHPYIKNQEKVLWKRI